MPVMAEVPLPWRRPVRVEAPVPPSATARSVVRVREEAETAPEKLAAAAVKVPVRVGLADITTLPVPVMALETRFLLASVKTACEAVRPEKLMVPGAYKVPETVSAVEEAYAIVVLLPVGAMVSLTSLATVKEA